MWCILAFIFSNLFSLQIAFMYGQLKGITNTKKWYEDKDKQLPKAKEIIDNLLSDNRIMNAQFESEEQAQAWFKHIEQAEAFLNSEVEK